MKKCTKCKEVKQFNQFSKHATNKNGLCGDCKVCRLKSRQKRQNARFKPNFSGEKRCVRCELNLPKEQFITNKSSKDGFNGWCKPCTKDAVITRKYNLSLVDYNKLLLNQEYKCALCKTSDPKGPTGEFVIDHCHKTNIVRGLLCNHCNTGLGKLGDTVESLEKALIYLKSNSGKIEVGD